MTPRAWIRRVEQPAIHPTDFVAWVEVATGKMLALSYDGEHRFYSDVAARGLIEQLLGDTEGMWERVA